MTQVPDYSDFLPAPADGLADRLQRAVTQLHKAEREEAELELQAAKLKEVIKELRERQLPALLAEMRLTDTTTESGLRVRVKNIVRASLPKDPVKRAAAFKWLIDNGHENLIKEQFVAQFGRGEYERAKEFATKVGELGVDLEQKTDIHHKTLTAFLQEQLADGVDVPLEIFGAYQAKVAEVETSK